MHDVFHILCFCFYYVFVVFFGVSTVFELKPFFFFKQSVSCGGAGFDSSLSSSDSGSPVMSGSKVGISFRKSGLGFVGITAGSVKASFLLISHNKVVLSTKEK